MDRVAVFVDAGYLFAQGSILLAGSKLPRSRMMLDYSGVVTQLAEFASEVSGLPILRVYWYDGTSTGPTAAHLALAHLPNVKVRLGFVNSVGQQKGVDSLIVTDLITLARNRAMSEAVLLSGDEDTRVGVQQAQEHGVRVHLLGIRPARGSQSLTLMQEADAAHEWGDDEVSKFLACRDSDDTAETATIERSQAEPGTDSVLRCAAQARAATIPESELKALVESIRSRQPIPRELDASLLAEAGRTLNRKLTSPEKRALRGEFLVACETRLNAE